jgi:bisphosphoglycerate-dependent phosphoglycerate mutase
MKDLRQKMLTHHNNLRAIVQTLEECQDLWMSDVKTLNEMVYEISRDFEFQPPLDDEGNRMFYANNWVLKDDEDDC